MGEEGERRKMDVVGVGIAAVDVICEVDAYPEEDTKSRALSSRKCRGGNGTNALVVCAQLGARCKWIGVSTDPAKDPDAALAFQDLEAFGIDCSFVNKKMPGSFPVSYILTSRQTGSRTIVHRRDMPDMSFEVFEEALVRYLASRQGEQRRAWFHYEGRNMDVVLQMMQLVREKVPEVTLSVEIEALRYHWQIAKKLMAVSDYVFVSKDYLREKLTLLSAEQFFQRVLAGDWEEDWNANVKAFICPWGADGVYYLDMNSRSTHHILAQRLDRIVESVGAGDTFIGAAIAALSAEDPKCSLECALRTACHVASAKCAQQGFKLPTKSLTEWRSALHHDATGA